MWNTGRELKKTMEKMYRGQTVLGPEETAQANPELRCLRVIARMHKGNLHIDSAPREGTTIRIHLPASGKIQGTSGAKEI